MQQHDAAVVLLCSVQRSLVRRECDQAHLCCMHVQQNLAYPQRLASVRMRTQATFAGKGNKALDNGVASTAGAFDNILMNGQEVFKFAVRAVPMVRAPSPRCHD